MRTKRLVLALPGLLAASIIASAHAADAAAEATSLESLAVQFVTTWSGGDHEGATATFDETMRGAMPPKVMKQAWDGLIDRMGAFGGIFRTRTEKWEEYDLVFVTCRFEAGSIDIKVVYNADRRISGLWFVPTEEPGGADDAKTDTEPGPPPYADPSSFEESDVTVGPEEWPLPGTIALPKGAGPFPAVVLVHGSGPNDRNETIGPNKPFRDIAWGLASRGIAVLRYDKRTKVYGLRMLSMAESLTVRDEAVDDAVAAARQLAAMERIDPVRIFVLGHSLGGTLAPRIGSHDPQLAGLIVLAGATRPLEDLTLEQYRYIFSLDGTISDWEQTALDTLAAQAARVKNPALRPDTPKELLPLGVSAPYWIDLRSYDPGATARSLEIPMLVLQGERDYQVTMEDYAGWKSLLPSPRIECKSYPRLNHLFMAGEGKSKPIEYGLGGHVDVEVIEDIAEWVKGH